MKNIEQTKVLTEADKKILTTCKQIITTIDPEAEVIIYGSRARGEALPDSDYDLLIITKDKATLEKEDEIRDQLYPLQLETGAVLTIFLISRTDWESSLYKAMPFHRNVINEGIIV